MSYHIHPQTVVDDCNRFRKLMGLATSDPDELQEMYGNLVGAGLMAAVTRRHPDATDEEIERMQMFIDVLAAEWPIRFGYMMARKILGPK